MSKTPQTSNQFALLDNEIPIQESSNPIEKEKNIKPPPIFIEKVSNIQPLITLLSQTVPNQYEIKVLRNEQVKILPKCHESYKKNNYRIRQEEH